MSVRWSGWSIVVGFTALSLLLAGAAQGASDTSTNISRPTCSVPPQRIGPSRIGSVGGIHWATARHGTDSACVGYAAAPSTQPSPAYLGSPPLKFFGGPVVGNVTPGELTVTPADWVPSGSGYSIPAGYQSVINQFIADAAADSGKITSVFSVATEYTNAQGVHLRYLLHAGTPITDTNAFPAGDCAPDSGAIWTDGTQYSTCITSAQLMSEASTFTTAKGLPNSDRSHLYMYFLPKGVETCFTSQNGAGGGVCSLNTSSSNAFCGFHSSYGAAPLVADMNFAFVDSTTGYTCSSDGGSNTGGNQSPNGNSDADAEISIASHEIVETITDPYLNAWFDKSGNEIGDDCSYIYGDSAAFQGSFGARYNQTINGHHYFIQAEFSNAAFAVNRNISCARHGANDITSAHAAIFTVGKKQVFKITTTGSPKPVLSATGRLPAGVTFVDNGNGTATLTGAPAARAGGTYPLSITANNSAVNAKATQIFELTVRQAPVFTTARTTTFKHGVSSHFRVAAVGPPTPDRIKSIGKLPSGVTLTSPAKGVGTLAATSTAKIGTYTLRFSVSSVLGTTKQTFKLVIK